MTRLQGEKTKSCIHRYYLKTLFKFQLISNYFNNKKVINHNLSIVLYIILNKKRAFRLFVFSKNKN
ncbi:hypothetical protein HMPREF0454_02998 [Hafnia alvei ATCC 51873]|uniref:Uncharacterized protein n=1 Tax=Hafnia alvei ATCC 51873 TaxID=1002364 RepID=G9Y8X7_HAFAL|nr:hypothetical protein HMPREF0454_02998 [Hafnia alvei ATCC 51873]